MKKHRLFALSGLTAFFLTACATISDEPPIPANTETTESNLPQLAGFDMQRCVNMGNSFEAPKDAPWGKPVNPADFAMIRAKGFDTVRIPVRWTDHMAGAPGFEIDPAFLQQVETAVQAALDAGLNVILNMHHNEEIMQSPEAAMPAYKAAWEQIAAHFQDAPDSLWFETLNEPFGALEGELMREAQRIGVATIRETNPERIIILGGESWSGIRTLDTNIAPPDANIVYTFHYYDPFDFTHQLASWLGYAMPEGTRSWGDADNRAELKKAAQIAVSYRAQVARPVFLGEFGANSPIPNAERVKWAGAVRAEMEANQVPWCLWAFSNTFALYDNEEEVWDEEMLKALGLTADQ